MQHQRIFFFPPDHKNHNPQKRDEPFNCIYTALPRKVAVAVIQLDHLQVGSHSLPLALFQLIHAKSLSKKKKKVLLQNIFFSTTWRFSMELKSGLCSRESMCENADLCFLEPICYHLCPMILGNVTATLQSVALQRKKIN